MARKSAFISHGDVVVNRKARFDYFIEDTVEAGLVLTGTEVKSLRGGKCNIVESYASVESNEAWLINAYIPEYGGSNRFNHKPRCKRKLLLHRKEINRLFGLIKREGVTIVPMVLYFNDRGMAKLNLGMAKGKKLHDKRATERDRDWDRQKGRLMREKGRCHGQ